MFAVKALPAKSRINLSSSCDRSKADISLRWMPCMAKTTKPLASRALPRSRIKYSIEGVTHGKRVLMLPNKTLKPVGTTNGDCFQ